MTETQPKSEASEDTPGAFIGQVRRSGTAPVNVSAETIHGDMVDGEAFIPAFQQWDGQKWSDI